MNPEAHRERGKASLKDQWMKLPKDAQVLIPSESFVFYERTNQMHCNPDTPGGSVFLPASEGGVDTIFDVITKAGANELADNVKQRQDDREALLAAGAPKNAFLPKERTDDPAEEVGLYFKIDNIKGELGIIQLQDLDPATPVTVLQEKESAPISFSVQQPEGHSRPKTDFATVIIKKMPGEDADKLWTIHPGVPIKPPKLSAFSPGDKITVQDLLDAGLTNEDYIKLLPES